MSNMEIQKAIRYVEQDIPDDFWPDPIGYADFFKKGSINLRNFRSKTLLSMDIPKPSLILRPGHFIDIEDRVYFHYLINKFARKVDKACQPRNVSYGYRVNLVKDKQFLHNNINSWKEFESRTESTFEKNQNLLLVKTDINAFFEHIYIAKLIELLQDKFKVDSTKLEQLLQGWCQSGFGLPQGNNCSSFLSNIYLDNVDILMKRKGYDYFRFVDDIRVFVGNERDARSAIRDLTELLRPLNLHLNSGKTEIVNKREFDKDKNKHLAEMNAIDYGIRYKKKSSKILDKDLKAIWKDAVKTKKINKTKFKFCIYRFGLINSSYPKNHILKNNLYDPAFSKEICEYLAKFINEKPVQNSLFKVYNESLYEWQRIHILKALLNSTKLKIKFSELHYQEIYDTKNILLLGYLMNFIFKYGDNAEKDKLKKFYYANYANNLSVSRYILIASRFLTPSERKDLTTQILGLHPDLQYTTEYLFPTPPSKPQPVKSKMTQPALI